MFGPVVSRLALSDFPGGPVPSCPILATRDICVAVLSWSFSGGAGYRLLWRLGNPTGWGALPHQI